jgi:histidyl-tRNA synthetase
MRGLLYYTGTVFEAFDTSGSLKRSLFGGGRYDNLLADVGGQPLSGVGFAMGDVGMGIFLQESGLLPEFQSTPAQVLVTVFDEKLAMQFKFADKMKIKVVLVLGPDEVEKGLVVIKNLVNGEQAQVKREALVESIKGLLGNA